MRGSGVQFPPSAPHKISRLHAFTQCIVPAVAALGYQEVAPRSVSHAPVADTPILCPVRGRERPACRRLAMFPRRPTLHLVTLVREARRRTAFAQGAAITMAVLATLCSVATILSQSCTNQERPCRHAEALAAIDKWRNVPDPVGLQTAEAESLAKREAKLRR